MIVALMGTTAMSPTCVLRARHLVSPAGTPWTCAYRALGHWSCMVPLVWTPAHLGTITLLTPLRARDAAYSVPLANQPPPTAHHAIILIITCSTVAVVVVMDVYNLARLATSQTPSFARARHASHCAWSARLKEYVQSAQLV